MAEIPGGGTIAADGVTVNSSSTILYTYSKGTFTMFSSMTKLQHLSHVTEAEVDDMVQVMTKSHEEMNGLITALAVDNAASTVFNQVTSL